MLAQAVLQHFEQKDAKIAKKCRRCFLCDLCDLLFENSEQNSCSFGLPTPHPRHPRNPRLIHHRLIRTF